MDIKKIKFFLILILISQTNFAQISSDSLKVVVVLKFDKEALELEKNYISAKNDTISFETIKFYLSDFQIIYKEKTIKKEKNCYHLIDFEKPETFTFSIPNEDEKEIESIRFNIGVDSLASVSGAMEGDLDATNGMYWAWQSGYINMKIEGKSNSCKTRKNKFQFHVGGYLEPYYAMRTIKIPIEKSQIQTQKINLIMDLGTLFSEISLKDTNTIMIPGKEAMKIADLTTNLFSIE
jgi:hypothetical protein